MKHLALLVPLVLLTACATTPTARWVQQREAITTTQDVIVSLHEADIVSDDAVRQVAPWIVTARNQVNMAYTDLPDGGPAFDSRLAQARDLIARIKALIREEQTDEPD